MKTKEKKEFIYKNYNGISKTLKEAKEAFVEF